MSSYQRVEHRFREVGRFEPLDRTHGVQFKAVFLRAAPQTTIEGIERYLGSGMIKGIGPVYGRKLVRAFGAGAGAPAAGRPAAQHALGECRERAYYPLR